MSLRHRHLVLLVVLPLILLLSQLSTSAAAKDSIQQSKRPKVGLVLSGGGARGFIHIGLLRILEEEGLRPDYVAGTSMGAVLGALYAIGYSPRQLSQLNADADWSRLLSNSQNLRNVVVDQKRWQGRTFIALPWSNGGFRLPLGIIEGQGLWNFLQRLMYPVAGQASFDSFPTPFRATAVDIFRGYAHNFKGGSLPQAVRASMAIPGVFTPVEYGDTAVYVDGGVADNFPIDAARAMGAKIIIGSYAGPPLIESEPGLEYSSKDILKQTSLFAGIRKAREDMPKCDLLFAPDLRDYSSMSFTKGRNIEAYGYREAEKLRPEIRTLATHLNALGPNPVVAPVDTVCKHLVRRVRIEGKGAMHRDFILSRLALELPDSLSAKEVESAIESLYSTQYFARITYRIDSVGGLRIQPELREKVELQLSYEVNEAWGPSLAAHLSVLNPLFASSRLSAAVGASFAPWAELDYSQYFSQRFRLLCRGRIHYRGDRLAIYDGGKREGHIWQHQLGGEMELAKELGTNALLALGGEYKWEHKRPNRGYASLLGAGEIESITYSRIAPYARLELNTLDRAYFPHSGHQLWINASHGHLVDWRICAQRGEADLEAIKRGFFPSEWVSTGIVNYSGFIPISRRFTAGVGFAGGLALRGNGLGTAFFVGGQDLLTRPSRNIPFYGLPYRMHPYQAFGIGRLSLRLQVLREFYIIPTANALYGTQEAIESLNMRTLSGKGIVGGGLRLGWHSPLGVVEGAVGMSSYTKGLCLYFMLGYPL